MKKICLYVNFLLITSLAASAQYRAKTVATAAPADSILLLKRAVLPANYTAGKLGFFCKKELLLEKTTKIPLRFRLGSVSYCDALEGKNRQYLVR